MKKAIKAPTKGGKKKMKTPGRAMEPGFGPDTTTRGKRGSC